MKEKARAACDIDKAQVLLRSASISLAVAATPQDHLGQYQSGL